MPTPLTNLLLPFLALATLTSTTPVPGDGVPAPLGYMQDYFYDDLLKFTLYPSPSCPGTGTPANAGYGDYIALQMQSYKLSRDLYDYEVLDFYTGFGVGLPDRYSVDLSMDGQVAEACINYDARAGVNATTHDNLGHGRKQGCHTLNNNEWCAVLWLPTDPS